LSFAGCGRTEVYPYRPGAGEGGTTPVGLPELLECGSGWVPGNAVVLDFVPEARPSAPLLLAHSVFKFWLDEPSPTIARYLGRSFDWTGAAQGEAAEIRRFEHPKGGPWPQPVASPQDDGTVIVGWVEGGVLQLVSRATGGTTTPLAAIATSMTAVVFSSRVEKSVLVLLALNGDLYVQALRDGAAVAGPRLIGTGELDDAVVVQGALWVFWSKDGWAPSTLTKFSAQGGLVAADKPLQFHPFEVARCEGSAEVAMVSLLSPGALSSFGQISLGRIDDAGTWTLAPQVVASGSNSAPAVWCAADRLVVTWGENNQEGAVVGGGPGNPFWGAVKSALRYGEFGLDGRPIGAAVTLDPRTDAADAMPQLTTDGPSLIAAWSRITPKGHEDALMKLECRRVAR
jgi:hypothetical protein